VTGCHTDRLLVLSSSGCHMGVACNSDGSIEKLIHNFSLKIKSEQHLGDLGMDGFVIN
jgi:hypothetical protein